MRRGRITRSGKQSGGADVSESYTPISRISSPRRSKEEATRVLNAPKRVGQRTRPQVSVKAIDSCKKSKDRLNTQMKIDSTSKSEIMNTARASKNSVEVKDVKVVMSRLIKAEIEKAIVVKKSEKLSDSANDSKSQSLGGDSGPNGKSRTLRSKMNKNLNATSHMALTKQSETRLPLNRKKNTSSANIDKNVNESIEKSCPLDENAGGGGGKNNRKTKISVSTQSRKKVQSELKAPMKTLKKADSVNANNDSRKTKSSEKSSVSAQSRKKVQIESKTPVKTIKKADSLNPKNDCKRVMDKGLSKSGDKDVVVDTGPANESKKTPKRDSKTKQLTTVVSDTEKKALKRKYSKDNRIKLETTLSAETTLGDKSFETSKPSSTQPLNKKRKTDPKSISKETEKRGKDVAAASVAEDPYDFEAYVSTFDIAKRKQKQKPKPKSSEKNASAPVPQKTVKGGSVKRTKALAHMFFIQPCRVKKKGPTVSSEQREEPSPSIADEIAEFNMQPPFAGDPGDEHSALCPPLAPAAQTKSVVISTPRHNLTGVPLLRPSQGPGLSPIVAASVTTTPASSSVAVLVESSRTNSPNQKASAPTEVEKAMEEPDVDKQEFMCCSASTEEDESGPQGKQKRKRSSKESKKADKEKDEFESWLAKFNQELSDIESFQLSIDRSQ